MRERCEHSSRVTAARRSTSRSSPVKQELPNPKSQIRTGDNRFLSDFWDLGVLLSPPTIISRRPPLVSPPALDPELWRMRGRGMLLHFGREFVAFSLPWGQNVGTEQRPPCPPRFPHTEVTPCDSFPPSSFS